MKKLFAVSTNRVSIDMMLILLRLIVGVSFIYYGSMKIQHPMNWMGEDSGYPGIFQALAAISEFFGGIALILGLVTRLAAFGIGCTMTVAVYVHLMVNGDPFVNFTGGPSYDSALLLFVIALFFLVIGPGRYSLDRLIFGRNSTSPH